jgi:hypothetical protein
MRALILLVAIVVVLALLGWVTFNRGDGRASINLETQEIREDTRQVLQSGSEALDRAGETAAPAETNGQRHEQSSADGAPLGIAQ